MELDDFWTYILRYWFVAISPEVRADISKELGKPCKNKPYAATVHLLNYKSDADIHIDEYPGAGKHAGYLCDHRAVWFNTRNMFDVFPLLSPHSRDILRVFFHTSRPFYKMTVSFPVIKKFTSWVKGKHEWDVLSAISAFLKAYRSTKNYDHKIDSKIRDLKLHNGAPFQYMGCVIIGYTPGEGVRWIGIRPLEKIQKLRDGDTTSRRELLLQDNYCTCEHDSFGPNISKVKQPTTTVILDPDIGMNVSDEYIIEQFPETQLNTWWNLLSNKDKAQFKAMYHKKSIQDFYQEFIYSACRATGMVKIAPTPGPSAEKWLTDESIKAAGYFGRIESYAGRLAFTIVPDSNSEIEAIDNVSKSLTVFIEKGQIFNPEWLIICSNLEYKTMNSLLVDGRQHLLPFSQKGILILCKDSIDILLSIQ
ncbi:MAG TPA: hypothetical protein PK014_08420 [Thermoanaerobaculia bacterium]|nr:hypothetical protein [Thermoanaerobaculia bacterium]HUM30147.1 hypothetical protein [Thermoanaerobaculia bacterium]HXK68403.1 hypothetical protein [Thermoanaerobaculia bacterium]